MSDDELASEGIPSALRERRQWVCWRTEDRDGKPTKVPVDPSTGRFASTTDPSTWSSFDRAYDHAQESESIAGLGFVFTDDGPFVGVDLDDCRDPETGRPSEKAKRIIDCLDSYTEVSPSGTGYHVIVRGTLPSGRNRHDDVECYETSRYFTVTGDHVPGTPETIEERSEELAEVHAEHVAVEVPGGTPDRRKSTVALDDSELVHKAMRAANGERFESLWNGSTVGYPSHSEADMALCCHLAFWTGGNPEQIDRLFRDSGLMREKWDEIHFSDGSTYGERTVSRAVERVNEHYVPSGTAAASVDSSTEDVSQSTERQTRGERTDGGSHRTDERFRTTLERLSDRIEALEAENERLRDRLADTTNTVQSRDTPSSGEAMSLWTKMKRFFKIT